VSLTLPETPTQPSTTPDVADVLAELESLGDPDLIAEALTAEGVLGTPCNAGMCAVAIYLQRETGIDDLNVGTFDATLWCSAAEPDKHWPLGPVVQEFIARFDSGSYPDLLWPTERAIWAAEWQAKTGLDA